MSAPTLHDGDDAGDWLGRQRAAIWRLLETHVAAWGRGDLGPLLDTYVQDESARYATAGTALYGIEAIRERFRRAYPIGEPLGSLRYEDVDIAVIGGTDALVFGRAVVSRPADGVEATSLFTLHLRVHGGEWRIQADHTSA